jgi:hypothetical protein
MTHSYIEGWLVVKRYEHFVLDPVSPLTRETVRQRYRGFDGIAWPFEPNALSLVNGLLPHEFYRDLAPYWRAVKQSGIELVYLSSDTHSPVVDGAQIVFCGYDYGNFVSEFNHFSSVLNEVVYGVNDEMRAFAVSLNGALLFDSRQQVHALQSVRRFLRRDARQLESEEEGEEFAPIAVFSLAY